MISPSNLHRRILCPGSEAAERGFPNTTSPAAAEGIRKHAVMEKWVKWVKMIPPNELQARIESGDTPWPGNPTEPNDEDCIWIAEILFPIIATAVIAGIDNDAAVMPEENFSRELNDALGMNKEGDPERCRLDLLVIHGINSATVYDYKFGQDLEDPGADPQMISYAIGVNERFSFDAIDVVKLNGMRRKVLSATLSAGTLEKYKDGFARAVVNSEAEGAIRFAGKQQCQYCRAKATCAEARDYEAGIAANPALEKPVEVAPVRSVADFVKLDAIGRGAFMGALDQSISQFKALRDDIEAWAIIEENDRGGPNIMGYEIGKGRGGRQWRNEIEAASSLAQLAKVNRKDPELIYEPKTLLSPAGAEKIFTGVEAKIHIASLVEPIIAKQKLVVVKK